MIQYTNMPIDYIAIVQCRVAGSAASLLIELHIAS